MRILHRYIIKEVTGPFILGLLIFTFIFVLDKIFELAELIISRGVDVWSVTKLFIYVLPSLVAIAVPMAVLLASLMGIGRLSVDNEITAVKASGVNIMTLAWPAIFISLFISIGMVWFNHSVLPKANHSFRNLYYDIVRQKASVAIKEKTFVNDFDGYILYVDKKDQTGGLKGVLIYCISKRRQPLYSVMAETGQLISDPVARRVILKLDDGEIHYVPKLDPSFYDQIHFKTYNIDLDINRALQMSDQGGKSYREMSITELTAELKRLHSQNINNNYLEVEIHKRISIPFACLAFLLIGLPLGIRVRGSRASSFGISAGLIMLYYLMLVLGELVGDKGYMLPIIALWLPNLILGGIGVYLLYLIKHEKPFLNLLWRRHASH